MNYNNEKRNIGAYFSANDAVYDWVVAFLNSFREFNPDLRLVLIPFDNNCSKVLELKDKYKFEIYEDDSFERLEKIGEILEEGQTDVEISKRWFRRYAIFWGPLDTFAYFDARQVVLSDVREYFQHLNDFDLLHYDCDLNQVYNNGDLRTEFIKNGYARGFFSGWWASKKGLFNLNDLEEYGKECVEIRAQLNSRNTDQAFFNYCCDKHKISRAHLAEFDGDLVSDTWARELGGIYEKGNKYYNWGHGGRNHKKLIPWMHWAGIRLNPSMPNFRLWFRFRYKDENAFKKIGILTTNSVEYFFCSILNLAKRNRMINEFYHRVQNHN